jgi:hypothetical protein
MKFKKFPFLNTKGFILKKDVYTTNLLFEHKRINFSTKNLIPFRNINPNPNDININEFLKVNSCRKLQKVESIFKPKLHKLKFPLNRIILPSKSNIDFYPNFKGNKIIYIDDDSNITSLNGKKINFSIKNEENKKFYEIFNRNHKFTNRMLINISKIDKNKKDFGVNTYNEYNNGFNDFKTIKIKKIKFPENYNNNNNNNENDLMFQTQIKFHNIYNNDN